MSSIRDLRVLHVHTTCVVFPLSVQRFTIATQGIFQKPNKNSENLRNWGKKTQGTGGKQQKLQLEQAFFCAFSKNSRGENSSFFRNSSPKTQGLFQNSRYRRFLFLFFKLEYSGGYYRYHQKQGIKGIS